MHVKVPAADHVNLFGYEVMLEAMRRSEGTTVPGLAMDVRNCFARGIAVSPGQALAAMDFLIEKLEEVSDSESMT